MAAYRSGYGHKTYSIARLSAAESQAIPDSCLPLGRRRTVSLIIAPEVGINDRLRVDVRGLKLERARTADHQPATATRVATGQPRHLGGSEGHELVLLLPFAREHARTEVPSYLASDDRRIRALGRNDDHDVDERARRASDPRPAIVLSRRLLSPT